MAELQDISPTISLRIILWCLWFSTHWSIQHISGSMIVQYINLYS